MTFKNVVKQGILIGGLSLIGLNANADDKVKNKENPFRGAKWERVCANRKTIGKLICNKLVREKVGNQYVTILEYYLDTNADNKIDYVARKVVPHRIKPANFEMGTILEFTEVQDEKGDFFVDEVVKFPTTGKDVAANDRVRKTVGVLLEKRKTRPSQILYCIDTDNDGNADVLRYRTLKNADYGDDLAPGCIIEIIEVQNSKGTYETVSVEKMKMPVIYMSHEHTR